jgi:hypothetical protein
VKTLIIITSSSFIVILIEVLTNVDGYSITDVEEVNITSSSTVTTCVMALVIANSKFIQRGI